MNLLEASQRIGKSAILSTTEGIAVNVTIKDYKNVYGKDRWLVSPKCGSGEVWVETPRLLLEDSSIELCAKA